MNGSEDKTDKTLPEKARYKVEYKPWWYGGSFIDDWHGQSVLYYWDNSNSRWERFGNVTVKDEWKWTGRISLWLDTRKALRKRRYSDSGKVPRKERTRVKYYS